MNIIHARELELKQNRFNPLTYGTVALSAALGALLFGPYFVMAEVAALFVLAIIGRVFPVFIQKWVKTALFVTIVVTVLQLFLLPGDTIVYQWKFLSITDHAIESAITVSSRLLGVFTPVIYFLSKVDIDDLIVALEQKQINPTVTYILSATFNMIPQMKERLDTITDAQRSRGIETEGDLLTRMKAYIPIIGPVILSSIVGVEEQTITLEVRGFYSPSPKTRLIEIPDSQSDRLIRKALLIVMVLMVIGKVILWLL